MAMPQDKPARTERFETIIIGNGRAALAVACELQRRDVDCHVLRDEGAVGALRRAGAHLEILAPSLRYEATCVVVALGHAQGPLDLRAVDGDPDLLVLGDVDRDAARVAAHIATRLVEDDR
jgi:hypothetical protein